DLKLPLFLEKKPNTKLFQPPFKPAGVIKDSGCSSRAPGPLMFRTTETPSSQSRVQYAAEVWQCGGSVEVLPCARIAHIERAHKPYTDDLTSHVRRNALRVAEVWMDEFKSHVYMAWNIPVEDSGIDIGDLSERKALRKRLQCKTFRWYLVNIYPEMRMYSDTIAYGVGPDNDNVPILYLCHGMTPQNVYYTNTQQLHIGLLSPTIDDDDNKCLVDVNSRPRLIECSYAAAKRMKLHWLFSQ
ncbi:hypothetical protein KUCAC02_001648, partial [Chaenocephalus aceratus]